MEQQSISCFEQLLFSFSADFFTYQLDFSLFWLLNHLPSASCLVGSNSFLCFFGCCECMLKQYHVPHTSRISTSGNTFIKICFCASNEWVRSWPHVFLILKLKRWLKSFWQSFQKNWREGKQEVGDDLSVCLLNILPKGSSRCDLTWPHVGHLNKGPCLRASYTKLAISLAWCRYIFCRWRYVFYLSRDPRRPLRSDAMQVLAPCHHHEKFSDHRYSDS